MNKEEFIKEVKKLGISIDNIILNKLDIYLNYLKVYNSHTNITAIKEDNDIYLKHFYDSLTTSKAIDLNKINNLLDVGSGAGFPGMIIKIFFPHIEVTLIDSNNKKIKFLEELSKKLNIKVNIIYNRVENYAENNLNKYDVVISRAVADLNLLLELSIPIIKVNGLFVALKGKIEQELKNTQKIIKRLNLNIIKIITFKLYKEEGLRNIIVIKKNKETKRKDLKLYDKIIKKSLVKAKKMG